MTPNANLPSKVKLPQNPRADQSSLTVTAKKAAINCSLMLLALIGWSAFPHVLPAQIQLDEVDAAITRYMQLTGATSGTVAINCGGTTIYTKGYGYSDRNQRVPTRAISTMRLASCTKPFTRTAIMALIDQEKLSRDTKIFEYLAIKPLGDHRIIDPRLHLVTVGHLLDHAGGWNHTETLDPMYSLDRIRDELGLKDDPDKRQIVQYMLGQPLQDDPGSEERYSNFGYVLLGMAIERATQTSYIEAIRRLISDPLEIDDLSIASWRRKARHPREVYYPRDSLLDPRLRDSSSGLIASAPSLCKFMNAYWIDGVKRDGSPRDVYFFQVGTHPFTTTTIMEQRLDGIDYALMLNARRNDYHEEDNPAIRENFNEVLDSLKHRLK